jgi:ligand-binding sensor domain-containing protein
MTLPFSRPLLFLSLFVIFGTREALTQNAYWEQTIGAESRRVYDLATNASGVVFAGTDRGMYRLTVHDGVWEEINNGIPGMYVQVTDVVIGPTGDIFAVMPNQGLYRSTNDGENWQLVFWPTGPRSVTVDSDGLIYLGTCLNEGIPECFGCHDG